MKNIEVNFPSLSNDKIFLEESSYLNFNNKIFISGGFSETANSSSKAFFLYEDELKSIRILPDLIEARKNHSMIIHDEFIYIIGGLGTNSMEIFDIENSKIENKITQGFNEVENPILFIHNNWLYSFFGKKNGKNLNIIQRLNLKAKNSKWEKFFYKNEDSDLSMNFTNAACVPHGSNEIFFFGGKMENGNLLKSVICFNFETKSFKNTKINLNEAYCFNNSSLVDFENGTFGAFAENEREAFIRINIDDVKDSN